jgi:hypothetical protein
MIGKPRVYPTNAGAEVPVSSFSLLDDYQGNSLIIASHLEMPISKDDGPLAEGKWRSFRVRDV